MMIHDTPTRDEMRNQFHSGKYHIGCGYFQRNAHIYRHVRPFVSLCEQSDQGTHLALKIFTRGQKTCKKCLEKMRDEREEP